MLEYVDMYIKYAWAGCFFIYSFVNLFKGWDAFKFYVSLALSAMILESIK